MNTLNRPSYLEMAKTNVPAGSSTQQREAVAMGKRSFSDDSGGWVPAPSKRRSPSSTQRSPNLVLHLKDSGSLIQVALNRCAEIVANGVIGWRAV